MDSKETARLKELLLDGELLDELKNRIDNSVNIFDVLKIADVEIRHSNMLAWILDPNENHGLGHEISKRLISWFASEYVENPDEAVELLMCNYYSFNVRREWRSIDLLLISSEAKIVFAIENKVKSNERRDQLSKYRKTIMGHFPDYRQYFLLLTLEWSESSEPEVWHSIGYEKIIEWVELSLNAPTLLPEVKQIFEQYLSLLRRNTMGYSEEVIELCNKIYRKHKEAMDFIYANADIYAGVSDVEDWCEEWEQEQHITGSHFGNKVLYFEHPL